MRDASQCFLQDAEVVERGVWSPETKAALSPVSSGLTALAGSRAPGHTLKDMWLCSVSPSAEVLGRTVECSMLMTK